MEKTRIKPLHLLKETTFAWFNHNAFLLSGALAYFAVFSLAPLLIVVIFVISLFWDAGSGRVRERVLDEMEELIGTGGAEMVATMLNNAQEPGSGGALATALGFGALLFGATAVFVQLKNALNTMWDVEPGGAGLKNYLVNRLLSFGMVLAVGFLLLVSLLISAALAAVDEALQNWAPDLHILMRVANLAVSFAVVTLLFAMIYRYLPDVEIAWRDVWVGAVITALLFNLGKFGIGVYLGNAGITSTYGAAGSFAVLLLWVYYSSLIFFFGAEFTRVYARHRGSAAGTSGSPDT